MNTDTEVLKGLLAKVEAATGADRELDAEICQALDIAPWTGWWRTQSVSFVRGSNLDRETPHLTASIDAALALVERALPDCPGYEIIRFDYQPLVQASIGEAMVIARTAPLAILGSLLTALIAHGGRHEG